MLSLAPPPESENNFNIVAPSVFIDNIIVFEKKTQFDNSFEVLLNYHLENDSTNWTSNDILLDNLYVNIELPSKNPQQIVLRSLINTGDKILGTYNFILANADTQNLTVTASCGNFDLTGSTTVEPIRINGVFVNSSFEGIEYKNISKIIDLSVLKFDDVFISENLFLTQNKNEFLGKLLISYRPDKKANVGFIFNLESFINNQSKIFRRLSGYADYRSTILSNSFIDTKLTKFYKKNVSTSEEEYVLIDAPISVYKLKDDQSYYLVTFTDDNKDVDDNSLYDIRCDLAVYDYSYDFYENKIKKNLEIAKKNLQEYINLFVEYSKQKQIKNINTYIFANEYENRKIKIKEIIDYLSEIFAFINSKANIPKTNYVKLFVSATHPLTTNKEILQIILDKINYVEQVFRTRVADGISSDENMGILFSSLAIRNKIYDFTTLFGDEYRVDYNYDENYGFEVFSTDSLEIRKEEPTNGLRKLNFKVEKDVRKILEARKYLVSPTREDIENVKTFSIASYDFGAQSYSLLDPSVSINEYNELYIKISEFNNYSFRYSAINSCFAQLAESGIFIQSLASSINSSKNEFFNSLVFDDNDDSRQESLELVTSTKLDSLFFSISKEAERKITFQNLSSSLSFFGATIQTKAAFPATNNDLQNSKFPLTEESFKNLDIFTKIVFSYGSIFKDNALFFEQNSNYDVYEIMEDQTSKTNLLTNSKFRQFNKFYIIENKKPAEKKVFSEIINYEEELNLNVESKYHNRNVLVPIIKTTVDIL